MAEQKWFNEMQKELESGNDRSLIIVACAMLDEKLKDLIKAQLVEVEGNSDQLFDTNMPLSTFSSIIEIAFRLRIIDRNIKETLNILRKIRNDCAHETKTVYLSDSPHKERINSIQTRMNHLQEKTITTQRQVAVRACMSLIGVLDGAKRNIEISKKEHSSPFIAHIFVKQGELNSAIIQQREHPYV